jgi:hypothetical protein
VTKTAESLYPKDERHAFGSFLLMTWNEDHPAIEWINFDVSGYIRVGLVGGQGQARVQMLDPTEGSREMRYVRMKRNLCQSLQLREPQ